MGGRSLLPSPRIPRTSSNHEPAFIIGDPTDNSNTFSYPTVTPGNISRHPSLIDSGRLFHHEMDFTEGMKLVSDVLDPGVTSPDKGDSTTTLLMPVRGDIKSRLSRRLPGASFVSNHPSNITAA